MCLKSGESHEHLSESQILWALDLILQWWHCLGIQHWASIWHSVSVHKAFSETSNKRDKNISSLCFIALLESQEAMNSKEKKNRVTYILGLMCLKIKDSPFSGLLRSKYHCFPCAWIVLPIWGKHQISLWVNQEWEIFLFICFNFSENNLVQWKRFLDRAVIWRY